MLNLPNIYLFPNRVNTFTHAFTHSEFNDMSQKEKFNFSMAVFPLMKHRWNDAYVVKHDNKLKLNIEINEEPYDNYKWKKASSHSINSFVPTKTSLLSEEYIHGNTSMSFECYAFIKCIHGISLSSLDTTVLRGLMVGGNRLKIFSSNRDNESSTIGVLGNAREFSMITLASLNPKIQKEIFLAWINKRPVILTGGTGVGKTSQVPKLLLWFNYLFGGFESLLKISQFKEKPVVLSLPRIALVRMHGKAYIDALGFNGFDGSPISLKFGSMTTDDINKHPRSYGIVISTHKLTLTRLFTFGTIILDEVHEHDQIGDIVIAVVRKKIHDIDSLFLMTATLDDDKERFSEFLPNPIFLHIPGKTLFPITDIYIRNPIRITDSRNYITKELYNIKQSIKKYSPQNGHCGIIFVATISQCKFYAKILSKTIKYATFYIMHGKIDDIDNLLTRVYNSNGVTFLVSTPYLESSVTIKNATHVYDTGKVFIPSPFSGGKQQIISKSMRDQRRGRVGRVRSGTYIYYYDPSLMKPIIRIDNEFLHPYILYSKYFGLTLPDDLLVKPSDLTILNKTICYIESFNLGDDQWFHILSNYYLTMLEYAKLYTKSKSVAAGIDTFERHDILTDNTLKNILSLQLRAKIITSKQLNSKYIHDCVIMFGPYTGTKIKVYYHRQITTDYIYMLTDTSFVVDHVNDIV
ncbi:RNA helicase [Sea otter poxvirus]|uniref:RNA helicase NPH-II n=1 Tax=Sea otter poxvirus TaxID=1416741 RepID=A0A2U9QHL7_9POXV|nr:RNA helicase [Sea otter poxvirus]AWU47094.1 RNA helicase [Sea otter poxvirus]